MIAKYLCLRIRFLGDEFHGRGNHGEPEWPPSPLRLFQTLVAINDRIDNQALEGLLWLELQAPPTIITPRLALVQSRGYTTYVPDNVCDLVAKSWTRGIYFNSKNHAVDISEYRSNKFTRSTRFEDNIAFNYLWPITNEADLSTATKLFPAVRSISQFGWGIDLVVADASIISAADADQLAGERWLPSESSGGQVLRVPVHGTFEDLKRRYQAFLNRISLDSNVFRPVPPLSCFSTATYRCADEIDQPPFAVFALRKPDDSGFAAFAPARRGLHLIGMLRHTASQPDFAVSLGWTDETIASFVLGHGESHDATKHCPVNDTRLVFLPLPSIEWRGPAKGDGVGASRRVLVTVSGQIDQAGFARIVNNLEGRELINEKTGEVVAFLRRQSDRDGAIKDYFQRSSVWTTVTPVILPGFDDPGKLRRRLNSGNLTSSEKANVVLKLDTRIDALLRKALRQAGYPEGLVTNADIQWRGSGFLPGVDLAGNYAVPNQHRRFRRLHVRIAWRDSKGEPYKIPGFFCIGGGRFTGFGLFTSLAEEQVCESPQ